MSVLAPLLRFNQASNAFFERRRRAPDPRLYYLGLLRQLLESADDAVHVGAGGKDGRQLCPRGASPRIWAVDPSRTSLARNPNPDRLASWGHQIPLASSSVDLVFSEYVMEHVADPEATLAEARRVLRPGGRVLWIAPNLWSYSGLATHLTPVSVHRLVTRLLEPVQHRQADADVFPTYFRVNSIRRIRQLLARTGLEIEELFTAADAPHYTKVLPGIHQLAVLWHVALDRFEILRGQRIVQVVQARRPLD